MKYLVMETHKSYCIVIDEAGRVIKAANFNYEVGQTVDSIYEMYIPKNTNFSIKRVAAFVGGIAACFALVLAFYFSSIERVLPTQYAFVYLEINPDVRIDVSEEGIVVQLTPLNDDGVTLLAGYDGESEILSTVIDELVERAIAMEYLTDGGVVAINIDSPDEEWFQDTSLTIRESLSVYLNDRVSVTVEVGKYITIQDEEPATSYVLPEVDEPTEAAAPTPTPTPPAVRSAPEPFPPTPTQPISTQQVAEEPVSTAQTLEESAQPPVEEPTQPPVDEPIVAPTQQSSAPEFISREDALAIALRHVGLTSRDIVNLDIEMEENGETRCFEIEFESGTYEYDFEVDGRTGQILSFKEGRL
jgi:uncharacterized membrane protein YkoI